VQNFLWIWIHLLLERKAKEGLIDVIINTIIHRLIVAHACTTDALRGGGFGIK